MRPQVRIGTRGRRSADPEGSPPGPPATAKRRTPLPHRSRPAPGPHQDRPRPARGSGRARRFRVTPHSGPETRVNSIAFSVHTGSFRLVQRHLGRGPFPTGTKRPLANGSSPSPPSRATGARPDTSRGGPWRGSASAWPRSLDSPPISRSPGRIVSERPCDFTSASSVRLGSARRRANAERRVRGCARYPPAHFNHIARIAPHCHPLGSWWSRSPRFGARQSGSDALSGQAHRAQPFSGAGAGISLEDEGPGGPRGQIRPSSSAGLRPVRKRAGAKPEGRGRSSWLSR